MALENLPALTVLDCDYQIQILAQLLRGGRRKKTYLVFHI